MVKAISRSVSLISVVIVLWIAQFTMKLESPEEKKTGLSRRLRRGYSDLSPRD